MDRILLGNLGKSGDCLYATILARQLRADYPDAHITWAISDRYAGLIDNNPHIDAVWKIHIHGGGPDRKDAWYVFEREALQSYRRGEFDHVVLSQLWPSNYQNYDGTIRPSILRAYGRPITVPIENVIALTGDEIERVEEFAAREGLDKFEHRILFECSPSSGQSFVNPAVAQDIAERVYRGLPNATVIFNAHLPMTLKHRQSRYSGGLSLRELAHLTKHCTLFVGCGSGASVAATSTAAQPLPMVQLLSASTSVYASLRHDFEYFAIDRPPILEMMTEDPDRIGRCIVDICRDGIGSVLDRFGSPLPLRFEHYFSMIEMELLAFHRVVDAARSLSTTAKRYGWRADLVEFARRRVAPNLALDPSWLFAKNRRCGEEFRARLEQPASAGVQR